MIRAGMHSRRWAAGALSLACAAALLPPAVGRAQDVSLADLSLAELSELEVTSVSKTAEPLSQAPAAIYVITQDEIIRSGVTSVVEALRLAPNLHLGRHSASSYVAGARGFAGAPEAQNFSNKLLILIDGRSVYSPLYSGVYLDVQDVALQDIDHIEVISGPGATLWGPNAMHGVINIITRPAWLTQGVAGTAVAGTDERLASLRYGWRIGDAAVRAYARAFRRDRSETAGGTGNGDDWNHRQAGFRADFTAGYGHATVQGDYYRGDLRDSMLAQAVDVEGANLLGRWEVPVANGRWQVQAYVDHTRRAERGDGAALELDTFDLEVQRTAIVGRHRFMLGTGMRHHDYGVRPSPSLSFEPPGREQTLFNAFVQDTIALGRSLDGVVGLKVDRDGFGGWYLLPEARLAWRPAGATMLWASAARAVRSPTPFDRDVVESRDGAVFVRGTPGFAAERLAAFELGFRSQPLATLSFTASVFANHYDELRTVETTSPTQILPLRWGNRLGGWTYGAEAWARWQVTPRWRLAPGVRLFDPDLRFEAGASRIFDEYQAGNDPGWQALLVSSLDITGDWRFDAVLRHVDDLPRPRLPAYTELDVALAWRASRELELSLTGHNLLHPRHQEYPADVGKFIPRGARVQVRWQRSP